MTISPGDFPEVSAEPLDDVDVDLPTLPGDWSWGSFNHLSNGKMNVYFGFNTTEVGGQYGEIDNYYVDGEQRWTVHVRPIVEAPSNPHDCRPRATGETAEEFDSLDEAIRSVPDHIREHYDV